MLPRLRATGAQLLRRAKNASSRSLLTGSALGGLTAAGLGASTVAASGAVHPPHAHWPHDGMWGAYDTGALRRGYEVYRQVCSTCHSMDLIYFRNLVGNIHTEAQAKALAESYTVEDGPNDEGEQFERPGKLADPMPRPYANEEMARFINGGALPPDLSCIAKSRHGSASYIFGLLTGYRDAPHGVELREGLHYNPYFEGGAISMAPPLSDGQLDYEDGTEATVSQMAADVSQFLAWVSEPEADQRKLMGLKMMGVTAAMIVTCAYYKRFKWNLIKTRRISWVEGMGEGITKH